MWRGPLCTSTHTGDMDPYLWLINPLQIFPLVKFGRVNPYVDHTKLKYLKDLGATNMGPCFQNQRGNQK